jgi:hypothetical protein
MITFMGCPSVMWTSFALTERTLVVFDSICISLVRTCAQKSAQAHTVTAGSAAEVAVGLSPSADLSPSVGPFMSQGALPGSPSLERDRREPAHVSNMFLTANAQAAQDLFDFLTANAERPREVGRPPAWTRGTTYLSWSSTHVGLDQPYSVGDNLKL